MTPEDWKYVENELTPPIGFVKLICDGYEVALRVVMITKMSFGVEVFVNGIRKGNWIIEECEESRRFYRRVERPMYKPHEHKEIKNVCKILGKKSYHDEKFVYFKPYWTNVTALRRHFCKHNQDIQLVREAV
jgi:hypothetical protein